MPKPRGIVLVYGLEPLIVICKGTGPQHVYIPLLSIPQSIYAGFNHLSRDADGCCTYPTLLSPNVMRISLHALIDAIEMRYAVPYDPTPPVCPLFGRQNSCNSTSTRPQR